MHFDTSSCFHIPIISGHRQPGDTQSYCAVILERFPGCNRLPIPPPDRTANWKKKKINSPSKQKDKKTHVIAIWLCFSRMGLKSAARCLGMSSASEGEMTKVQGESSETLGSRPGPVNVLPMSGSPLTTERPLTPSGRPPGSPHTARLASWARHPVLASRVCWPQRLQDSKTDSEPRKILGHINRKSWAGDQLGYLDQNSFSSLRPSFFQSVR